MPLPDGTIAYSAEEDAVWRDLVAQQQPRMDQFGAQAFLAGQRALDLPQTRVPQCGEVSAKLMALTGWRVEPVPGLTPYRDFFGMLAQKTFPAASFIRSRESFEFSEEPDIFHEIYGHGPLLADPRFAEFSHAIGRAGMACAREDYAWLIRLYWFGIEFGLIREGGVLKSLGTALASSPTELTRAIEGKGVERRPFDVIDILRTPYRIDIPQPIYFVLEDADQMFEAAKRDLQADIAQARAMGLHAPKFAPKK
jgi:phenylalanine-4-hydroxylase